MHNSKFHATLAVVACVTFSGAIQSAGAAGIAPSSVFMQAGFGDQKTDAYVAGISWDLPWRYDFGFGTLGAYVEVAFGRWHTRERPDETAWPTQLSAVPNLRFYPARLSQWFFELGAGPSYIVPLFHSGDKDFSTEFNFDDHIAMGRDFGHSEVSLRAEHFSNAGISHPNPGENFAEIRYAYRF
jgi:hypothetical protein